MCLLVVDADVVRGGGMWILDREVEGVLAAVVGGTGGDVLGFVGGGAGVQDDAAKPLLVLDDFQQLLKETKREIIGCNCIHC